MVSHTYVYILLSPPYLPCSCVTEQDLSIEYVRFYLSSPVLRCELSQPCQIYSSVLQIPAIEIRVNSPAGGGVEGPPDFLL